jgi:hypothetical protein
VSGLERLNFSNNLSKTIRNSSDSSLNRVSETPKVMNSVFGALMAVQLVSRTINNPAAIVLKIFSQCTAGAAMSTLSPQN